MITLFILIYLISFALHLLIEYKENKRRIHYVGDLIDNIEFYMWLPVLNTFTVIIWTLLLGIIAIWKVSKLDILWQKFRNIRLK
jgi:hypothetical protein